MAVYKIPQDVEADDKFVGPLSFKQFIFVGIAVIASYLTFLSLTKGFWPAVIFFFPVIIVTGFLGFPWGRDQPTEIWLAARIRFFLKPRVRVWNQSGIKDLVTVTAPKHIEKHFTNGLSQTEVSSRLTGLADLLDSRGWAVKNVNINMYSSVPAGSIALESDDRLLDVAALPQEVVDVTANDDILDENTSPTAQHFEEMIRTSEQKHREEVMQQLQAARSEATPNQAVPVPAGQPQSHATQQGSADFWFLQEGAHKGQHISGNQIAEQIAPKTPEQPGAGYTTFQAPSLVAPHGNAPTILTPELTAASQHVSAQDEEALLAKIHKDHDGSHNPFGNIKTIMPLSASPDPVLPVTPATAPSNMPPSQSLLAPIRPVTPPVDPAIMNLANNDDLNVATLARQAEKRKDTLASDGEVIISLH